MKVILVGAGGVNRALLRRLSEAWEAVVIDPDERALAAARAARTTRAIEVVRGDGSSRVVLERAGLADADALIAASADNAVNLEACRIALDASVQRVAALAREATQLDAYRALGVPVFSRDELVARHLEGELEPRRIISQAFAEGHGELLEIRVLPDSPAADRAVQDLPRGGWLAAAVLRGGNLIIPRGDTVIRPGDTLSIITSAANYGEMVRLFASSEQRFPLQYGNRVVVVPDRGDGGILTEAAYLTRNSRARSLALCAEGDAPVISGVDIEMLGAEIGRDIARMARLEAAGLLVVPPPRTRWLRGRATARLLRVARDTPVALLVARDRTPYRTIVAPARETAAGHAAAFAAIDLARAVNARLIGVAVAGPEFLSGPDARDEARRALRWFQEAAALQGLTAEVQERPGNPVHALLAFATECEADLIVVGAGNGGGPWRVDVTAHVVRRASASVLAVPAVS